MSWVLSHMTRTIRLISKGEATQQTERWGIRTWEGQGAGVGASPNKMLLTGSLRVAQLCANWRWEQATVISATALNFDVTPCVWKKLRVQLRPNNNNMVLRAGWRSTGEEQKRKLKKGQWEARKGQEAHHHHAKALAPLCRPGFLKVSGLLGVFPLDSIMVLDKNADFLGGRGDIEIKWEGCSKRRQEDAPGEERTALESSSEVLASNPHLPKICLYYEMQREEAARLGN